MTSIRTREHKTESDIRRNDTVQGDHRTRQGQRRAACCACFQRIAKVLVEHVMLVKKHVRPIRSATCKGGIAEQESRIAISNVQLVCPAPAVRCASDTKCRATAKFASATSAGRRWISS
mgnify:CR=1 FL=1